ncbi:Hypothetical protein A7982_10802 [Minicystis rosea]|nr:Hypothetical protein A7982_10802 [Minicystis rosea]
MSEVVVHDDNPGAIMMPSPYAGVLDPSRAARMWRLCNLWRPATPARCRSLDLS